MRFAQGATTKFFTLKFQLICALVVMTLLPVIALGELTARYLDDARHSREAEFMRASRDVFHGMEERSGDVIHHAETDLGQLGALLRLSETDLQTETAITRFRETHEKIFTSLVVVQGDRVRRSFGGSQEALADIETYVREQRLIKSAVDHARIVLPGETGTWEVTNLEGGWRIFYRVAIPHAFAPMIVHTSQGKGVALYVQSSGVRWPRGAEAEPIDEHWESRGEASELAQRFDQHEPLDLTGAGGTLVQADARHVFVAPSYDRAPQNPQLRDGPPADAQLIAAIDDSELYKGLDSLSTRRDEIVAACLLLACALALYIARNSQRSINRIAEGIEAMGKGEWRRLEERAGGALGSKLVTTLNQAMESAARAERETWLALLRNVAHEVNNTLAPIKAMAQTLGDNRKAELIVERADALAGFVDRCSELARLPPPRLMDADLAVLVRSVVSAHDVLFAEAGISLSLTAQPSRVRIDTEQMERVLINLLGNALDAAKAHVNVTVANAGVTITDDGDGVAEVARSKLFVPFFTTKPNGSGLGLALARQIVLAHGGSVSLRNAERGAVATVELPHG